MPLPKYYCDYCDKQFQDTASARRRHLQGVQHHRARALWYDSFKEPNQIQTGGSFGRGVCNHFLRTGFCQYGDSCKYFHPKQTIQNPNATFAPVNVVETGQSPIMVENQLTREGYARGDVIRDGMGIALGNLPPSLRPPLDGGYPPLPFVDWG